MKKEIGNKCLVFISNKISSVVFWKKNIILKSAIFGNSVAFLNLHTAIESHNILR